MATDITAITGGTPSNLTKRAMQFQGLFDIILSQVTLTDATLAANKASQVDVTVPGVALGDFVFVSTGVDNAGLVLDAWPSAADTVTITAWNVEGTDAVTALSGGVEANILILKPKGPINEI